MRHDVTFNVPERPVGQKDIVFSVRTNGNRLGRLKISKGCVVWLPGWKSKGFRLNWAQLDRVAREYEKRAKGDAVKIPRRLREELGRAVVGRVVAAGCGALVLSVSAKHLHVLVELPVNPASTRTIVGKWKTVRTPAVRAELPGSIWGEGGKYKPVKDRAHQRSVFKYIRDEQGPGAWVWTFKDPV